jgi:hypothetical protein
VLSGPPSIAERTFVGHLEERFEVRAKALVYARLAIMSLGLFVLAVPAWRATLQLRIPNTLFWYLSYVTLLVIHVGSWLWVGRRHAHAVVFGLALHRLAGPAVPGDD